MMTLRPFIWKNVHVGTSQMCVFCECVCFISVCISMYVYVSMYVYTCIFEFVWVYGWVYRCTCWPEWDQNLRLRNPQGETNVYSGTVLEILKTFSCLMSIRYTWKCCNLCLLITSTKRTSTRKILSNLKLVKHFHICILQKLLLELYGQIEVHLLNWL